MHEVSQDLWRSSRPGYPSKDVNQQVVEEWLENVRGKGIKTIICLLENRQLDYYASLRPLGLLDLYRQWGFDVIHREVRDHENPPVSERDLQQISQDFQAVAKPVLVHCSAGLDRTGAVVAFLMGGHHV